MDKTSEDKTSAHETAPVPRKVDFNSVIGVMAGGLIVWSTIRLEQIPALYFMNFAALLLVVGGVLAATVVSFGWQEIDQVYPLFIRIFVYRSEDPARLVENLIELAQRARREGLLGLENQLETFSKNDPFLRDGLRCVVDGIASSMLISIMERKLELIREKHRNAESVFMTMGGYAPTMGIIGTVLGLIHVLGNMASLQGADTAVIIRTATSGIAGAFMATFYGITLANLVFLPFASKLRIQGEHEVTLKQMAIEGFISIQAGDNPRLLQEKLQAYFPSQSGKGKKKKEKGKAEAADSELVKQTAEPVKE